MRIKVLGLSLTCVVAVAAAGCDRYPNGEATTTPAAVSSAPEPNASTPGNVRVADVVGNPDAYLGKVVTLEADVEEVHSPFAFELDEDSPLAGGIDNDLLVFSKKSANLSDIDDQWLNNKVRVKGTVQRMSVVEIERETGWDLDPKIEVELERVRPVLIAESVARTGN